MNLALIGINHRTAPLEIRERLWFSDEELAGALLRLRESYFSECFMVSTCNRTELYGVIDTSKRPGGHQTTAEAAATLLIDIKSARSFVGQQHLYKIFDSHAAHHLLKVASGVDSMIIGDIQILGQVKNHYAIAVTNDTIGPYLNRLVQTALHVGKRVRTETTIAKGAVSVSYAAVELATKIFSNLSDKKILLIGAGETGELTAKNLVDRGVASLFISNRTRSRADELATKLTGMVIPFDGLGIVIHEMDVVISSVTASNVVDTRMIRNAMKARANTPMLLIDLGVPRNFDPAINSLENAFLYDLDSLSKIVSQNLERRRGEITAVNTIILEELTALRRWFESLQVGPTISDLRDYFESVRADEVRKHVHKFGAQDREMLELVTKRIINKLLHGPSMSLKGGNGESAEERHQRISMVRNLFGLHKGRKEEALKSASEED